MRQIDFDKHSWAIPWATLRKFRVSCPEFGSSIANHAQSQRVKEQGKPPALVAEILAGIALIAPGLLAVTRSPRVTTGDAGAFLPILDGLRDSLPLSHLSAHHCHSPLPSSSLVPSPRDDVQSKQRYNNGFHASSPRFLSSYAADMARAVIEGPKMKT